MGNRPQHPSRRVQREFPRQSLHAPRWGVRAFSLVEVVIAIAVCAFVLVSILGIMAYSSQVVQQADNYSRLSSISSQMLAQINSQPYSVTSAAATTNATNYYTFEGLPTNAAAAYYQCNITNCTPTTWTLPNVMLIQMTIKWPKPFFNNTNIIISSTLNYE